MLRFRTKTSAPFASVLHVFGSAAFALSITMAVGTLQNPSPTRAAIVPSGVTSGVSVAYLKPAASDERHTRRALAKSLWKASGERVALMRRSTDVTLTQPDGTVAGTWKVSMGEHPSWVTYDIQRTVPAAVIDADAIAASIVQESLIPLPKAVHCQLNGLHTDKQDVVRAETSCIARNGYSYDARQIAAALKEALAAGTPAVSVPVEPDVGTLADAGDLGIGDVMLLSTGHSNFKGSGEGRKNNVRKAIGEQVNNVVVPAGAEFSFNDVLGGPVTTSAGWSMALTIFDGTRLEMAPGGGICQASTTVYRAALKAGLPIVEHKSHSMYVTYYEAYGVGQDATVFPGKQNLKFLNDTGSPLVLQSYYEGDEAYVNILGRPDGREVTIEGPYFGSTAPKELQVNGRAVRDREIVWVRTVKSADDNVTKEVLVSQYNAVPRSLVAKWPSSSETIVHAAAPEFVADQR